MSSTTRHILLVLSVIFGLLGLIPIVGDFTDILYWLIWGLVMLLAGLEYLAKPKILIMGSLGFLLGLIPIVGGPLSTVATIINDRMIKSDEDKKAAAKQGTADQEAQNAENEQQQNEEEENQMRIGPSDEDSEEELREAA